MTKTHNGVVQRLRTEIFTGSGNSPDDARESAFARYQSWKVTHRREGRLINEVSAGLTYSQRNPVYCRCALKVEYLFL